jgi:hypothetical protein
MRCAGRSDTAVLRVVAAAVVAKQMAVVTFRSIQKVSSELIVLGVPIVDLAQLAFVDTEYRRAGQREQASPSRSRRRGTSPAR